MLIFIGLIRSPIIQELPWNMGKSKAAIQGYDVISYFEETPSLRSEKFSGKHDGGTFYFNSEEHLRTFQKTPNKYLPAYGGRCAYSIAETRDKVKIDPKTYTITDGKLYLFYNFHGNNALIPWIKDESKLILDATKIWRFTIH